MPTSYDLTLVNDSEIPDPTFAVFAPVPVFAAYDVLDVAWVTQPST